MNERYHLVFLFSDISPLDLPLIGILFRLNHPEFVLARNEDTPYPVFPFGMDIPDIIHLGYRPADTFPDQLADELRLRFVKEISYVLLLEPEEFDWYKDNPELPYTFWQEYEPSYKYARKDYSAQAFCAAYVVASKYGLDTSRFNMEKAVKNLEGKEPKELRNFLTDIRYGAGNSIHAIERSFRESQQTVDQDFSVSKEQKKR